MQWIFTCVADVITWLFCARTSCVACVMAMGLWSKAIINAQKTKQKTHYKLLFQRVRVLFFLQMTICFHPLSPSFFSVTHLLKRVDYHPHISSTFSSIINWFLTIHPNTLRIYHACRLVIIINPLCIHDILFNTWHSWIHPQLSFSIQKHYIIRSNLEFENVYRNG